MEKARPVGGRVEQGGERCGDRADREESARGARLAAFYNEPTTGG